MRAANCNHCGKLTLHTPSRLCPECLIQDYQSIQTIKRYMTEHPRASFMEVVNSTGISYRTVRRLMTNNY